MRKTIDAAALREPQVMAILNVTPDSFWADSRMSEPEAVERRVREAVAEGASIIDVGGYSSRPGAAAVSVEEEWRRVACGVEAVRRVAPDVTVSVDTFRASVALRVVERFGPVIVNDITAGEGDPDMLAAVARCGVPYVAMHMRGTPETMQTLTDYDPDVTTAVVEYFRLRTEAMRAAGIAADRIAQVDDI